MTVAELRALQHGQRVQEAGRGGAVGVVESVGEKHLRIRWEGGDSVQLDTANALECSYFAVRWVKLEERPTPTQGPPLYSRKRRTDGAKGK